ncbi:hypothetical protein BCR44DRAFT_300227 [Catenaria anguillulae PL171]|uniref:Uncharacterized protein n=1 Tax=Catenaria anguillulae PL171 TaxID=765915 RepID=A0A1Y2HF31_9FUNG|nr:hypothetical protein BCR44DRAFT_300227 [Catenaria anguillulae PL171]
MCEGESRWDSLWRRKRANRGVQWRVCLRCGLAVGLVSGQSSWRAVGSVWSKWLGLENERQEAFHGTGRRPMLRAQSGAGRERGSGYGQWIAQSMCRVEDILHYEVSIQTVELLHGRVESQFNLRYLATTENSNNFAPYLINIYFALSGCEQALPSHDTQHRLDSLNSIGDVSWCWPQREHEGPDCMFSAFPIQNSRTTQANHASCQWEPKASSSCHEVGRQKAFIRQGEM